MKAEKTINTRVLILIALCDVAEVLALFAWKHTTGASYFALDLLLGLWIAFLGAHWSWGYNRLFTKGIWFWQEQEGALRDGTWALFCFLYGLHIVFSLGAGFVFLRSGQLLWALVPLCKLLLIGWTIYKVARSG